MNKFGNISIPDIPSGIGRQYETTSSKTEMYRGIFANLLVQGILLDTIGGIATCQKCPKAELNNMIIDTVGVMAATRS